MSLASLVARKPLRRGDTGLDVKALQLALRAAGHELVTDSEFGGITETAVRDFQQAHRLAADGVVGPLTAIALDRAFDGAVHAPEALLHEQPLASVKLVAPWLSQMRAITGTKELAGGADSATILSWVGEIVAAYPDLKGNVGWYKHDSIPWCGLGEAICMVRAGKKPPLAPLGAINWLDDWAGGHRLKEPCLGAIGIKSRAGGNHVFTYEGEDATHYWARGANQSDMVCVAAIAKDDSMRGWMWPNGEPQPQGGRVFTSFANAKAGSEA